MQPPKQPRRRLPFPRMPSGKRARQRGSGRGRGAPPPVRSKGVGGPARARRRRARSRSSAVSSSIAVIAIVLGVVLSSGGGGGGGGRHRLRERHCRACRRPGMRTSAGGWRAHPTANNLFKGIPQNGLVLGKPKAPVEMEMFIDVQCPICQDYEVNNLPTVVKKYIKTGKVQLHLQPWAFIGGRVAVVHRPARPDRRRRSGQGLRVREGPLRQPAAELGEDRLADRQVDGADRGQRERPQPGPMARRRQRLRSASDCKRRRQAREEDQRSRARRTSSSAPPAASCRSPARATSTRRASTRALAAAVAQN